MITSGGFPENADQLRGLRLGGGILWVARYLRQPLDLPIRRSAKAARP